MAVPNFNIEKILKDCRNGKSNSQRQLYEHFYGYGMSVALRYSHNQEEGVEVLNDAFLKVFRTLDNYDSKYDFKPWFRRVLINSAIDYHRKHHKFPILLDINDYDEAYSEEMQMPTISPNEDLLPILQQLSPAYRIVFNLYVMEDYSHKEIADQLGITVGTSKSNLMRAKRKLKTLLENGIPLESAKTN